MQQGAEEGVAHHGGIQLGHGNMVQMQMVDQPADAAAIQAAQA